MRSGFGFRVSGFAMVLSVVLFASCGKDDTLTSDEIQYVKLTVSLAKTKPRAKDSLGLMKLQDSVYKVFATLPAEYEKLTLSFAENSERGRIVFQAIGDSLKIR